MNIIEALKTGQPLRRPIAKHLGSGGDGCLVCADLRKNMLQVLKERDAYIRKYWLPKTQQKEKNK